MTFREKIKMEHPEQLDSESLGGVIGCPHDYGYEETADKDKYLTCIHRGEYSCRDCWNREMPEKKESLFTSSEKVTLLYKMLVEYCTYKGLTLNTECLICPYRLKIKIDTYEYVVVWDEMKNAYETFDTIIKDLESKYVGDDDKSDDELIDTMGEIEDILLEHEQLNWMFRYDPVHKKYIIEFEEAK